jgi:hypothetical protein
MIAAASNQSVIAMLRQISATPAVDADVRVRAGVMACRLEGTSAVGDIFRSLFGDPALKVRPVS